MSNYIIVTTAIDDKSVANQVTKELLKKRLVSCVQTKEVISNYWWKGKLEETKEYILQMKSKKVLYKEIEEEIKQIHGYETPEIFSIEIKDGNKDYLDWIEEETK